MPDLLLTTKLLEGGGGKEGLEPAQPSQWWRPYNNKIEINKTFLLSNEMSISLGLLIFAS